MSHLDFDARSLIPIYRGLQQNCTMQLMERDQ